MNQYASFDIEIDGLGAVHGFFCNNAKTIKLQSEHGLLFDGSLFSLDAAFGLHGDGAWYPVSGVTITGIAGSKAPKKVFEPIMLAVTAALNSHISANADLIVKAKQQIYDARTESLRHDIEYYQRQLESYTRDVAKRTEALDKHLAAKP